MQCLIQNWRYKCALNEVDFDEADAWLPKGLRFEIDDAIKAEADGELGEAMPAMEAANEAVNCLNKGKPKPRNRRHLDTMKGGRNMVGDSLQYTSSSIITEAYTSLC